MSSKEMNRASRILEQTAKQIDVAELLEGWTGWRDSA